MLAKIVHFSENISPHHSSNESQDEVLPTETADLSSTVPNPVRLLMHSRSHEKIRSDLLTSELVLKRKTTCQIIKPSLQGCKVCYSDESTYQNPLLAPCKCTGSVRLIHLDCLRTWLQRKDSIKVSHNGLVTSYSWRAFQCELCKGSYPETVPNPHLLREEVSLVGIEKPDDNFLVLESYIDSELEVVPS